VSAEGRKPIDLSVYAAGAPTEEPDSSAETASDEPTSVPARRVEESRPLAVAPSPAPPAGRPGKPPPKHTYSWWFDRLRGGAITSADYAQWRRQVAEGPIHAWDGTPLAGLALRRARHELLGTYDDLPPIRAMGEYEDLPVPGGSPGGFLIPGLLKDGHQPFLGGNPKSGRSTLVCDLTATLVSPGYQFLQHFPPAEVDTSEGAPFWGGVVVVNAENPPKDYEEEMRERLAGLPARQHPEFTAAALEYVALIHLEDYGGPASFDLTDPAKYEQWSVLLSGQPGPPFFLIVDGYTAILTEAGKDPEDYNPLGTAQRRLTREMGTRRSLAVGHNILSGGHPVGGTLSKAWSDGLWTLSKAGDAHDAPRWFATEGRMTARGVSRLTVSRDPDGRLRATRSRSRGRAEEVADRPAGDASPADLTEVPATATTGPSVKEMTKEYVGRANAAGYGPSARDLRQNVAARNPEVDQARDELVAAGELVVRPRVGRGGGLALWLVDPVGE
jgi:hypothetical protein